MAEETATPAAAPSKEEVVVVPETTTVAETQEVVEETKPSEEESAIPQSVSFKEESNRVADLQDPEKIALDEFKSLIQQALNNHEFTLPPPPPPAAAAPEEEKPAVVVVESTAAVDAPKEESDKEAPAPAVVEEVAAEADGSKTVEAIEESIVPVTKEEEPEASSVVETKEEETSTAAVVEEEDATPPPPPEEIFIWGIPLVGDEKSDTVLLKFLRARDFKVKDAFTMLKNTVLWRKEFGIDGLLEEDLGGIEQDLDKVVFMSGFDKEGHPVCYNVYGEFQNKDLYQKTFSDEEKSLKFLRWRIQFLEKSIQKLDFTPGAVCTIVQVNDLKNSPGPLKKELRHATNRALSILQDNYPEFVAKQVFINVPWWYLAFNRMISPFLTQRTKSKFVFAGPSKSAETLFKYVAPEQVPVQYGGLSKEGDQEFSTADAVTDVTIKPATKQTVEIPVSEASLLVWEVRVIGWDVSYGAEFVPSAEDGYTIIVEKTRKIAPNTDETVISNSFKVGEPGKVVLTIDNSTSKKKKLLYRFKIKPSTD